MTIQINVPFELILCKCRGVLIAINRSDDMYNVNHIDVVEEKLIKAVSLPLYLTYNRYNNVVQFLVSNKFKFCSLLLFLVLRILDMQLLSLVSDGYLATIFRLNNIMNVISNNETKAINAFVL